MSDMPEMVSVRDAFAQYQEATARVLAAEDAVQQALQTLKQHAHRATLKIDGQIYQVRERNQKLYLCVRTRPCGRPVGSRNKAVILRELEANLAAQKAMLAEPLSEDADAPLSGVFPTEQTVPENQNGQGMQTESLTG